VNRQFVLEQWDQFARMVLPPDCHPIQRKEMRLAFYAGIKAALELGNFMSEEGDATDNDVELLRSVHAELDKFTEDVKGGRA